MSDDESTGFDFFRCKTAGEISGCFASDLWQCMILRLSHDEPSIMTSVVALGALHLSLKKAIDTPGRNKEGIFALQQYGKAIRKARNRINAASVTQPYETALICCLLFICIEMLLCDPRNALMHLQTGRRILLEHQRLQRHPSRQLSPVTYRNNSLMQQLLAIFARLDYEATSFGVHLPTTIVRPAYFDESFINIPNAFSNIGQARRHLDSILSQTYMFKEALLKEGSHNMPCDASDWATQYCWDNAASRMLDLNKHPDFSRRASDLRIRLEQWLSSFTLMQQCRASPTPHEARAAQLLQTQHLSTWLCVSTFNTTWIMDHDQYLPDFVRLVQIARDYIQGTPSLGTTNVPLPIFTVESGIYPPLLYVTLNCRDSHLRREALSLLSEGIRQEGLCVGKILAWYAEQLIDLEEREASTIGSDIKAADIPEDARFSDVVFAVSEDTKLGRLVCAKFDQEGDRALRIVEHKFPLPFRKDR